MRRGALGTGRRDQGPWTRTSGAPSGAPMQEGSGVIVKAGVMGSPLEDATEPSARVTPTMQAAQAATPALPGKPGRPRQGRIEKPPACELMPQPLSSPPGTFSHARAIAASAYSPRRASALGPAGSPTVPACLPHAGPRRALTERIRPTASAPARVTAGCAIPRA